MSANVLIISSATQQLHSSLVLIPTATTMIMNYQYFQTNSYVISESVRL